MTLRLLLVDDEAPARTRLRDLLGDIADEVPTQIVAEAADGIAALQHAQEGGIDLALVDIRMPGMDGIECARHLARLPSPPAVIFVTAYEQYAVQAFDLAALDYLLKPVRASRLAEALKKSRRPGINAEALQKSALTARHHLSCMERGRILLVAVADILYFKAEQKYVTARTAAREYLLEESLVQLEHELGADFLRIHRNCLVARQAVTGMVRAAGAAEADPHGDQDVQWHVTLAGCKETLLISRRQWPLVRALLR